MDSGVDELRPSGTEKFKRAHQYLLPNEHVQHICQIEQGFLVLSSRRAVILKEEGQSEYCIEKVIPYDCIIGLEAKNDNRFVVSGIAVDQYGCHTGETRVFEVKAPRGERGENKDEVRQHFQSTMAHFVDVIEEIRHSEDSSVLPLSFDYSYLEKMPHSLTRDAILDLNTILRDQPIPDQLVHEAKRFLGDEPFLLEESLRDGNDNESGVLFAAGSQGYYWIQGKKQGRFMSNVIVNTVEWENVRGFAHLWHQEIPIIYATYSPTTNGIDTTVQYLWNPSIYDDTLHYLWLFQPLNGPWILADVMYKYTGKQSPIGR